MTYSIIAFDKKTKTIGSAGATKWFALGADVPVYRQGVGLVHAQSYGLPLGGEICLDYMAQGKTPTEALELAVQQIPNPDLRQYIACDNVGAFAVYSGVGCPDFYGSHIGIECAAAGNILASPDIFKRMVDVYENTDGPMEVRLLAALNAAQALGGD